MTCLAAIYIYMVKGRYEKECVGTWKMSLTILMTLVSEKDGPEEITWKISHVKSTGFLSS